MAKPIEKFLQKVCVQRAVYWGSPVPDGYGRYVFLYPTELLPPTNGVRWEDTTELLVDAKGEQFVTKAKIMVCQDLDVGGYIYLGEFSDIPYEGYTDPTVVKGAYQIRRFDKVPTFRSTSEFVRTAYV
jgi:hypothetical protein